MRRHFTLKGLWTALASFGLVYLVTQASLYRKVATDSMFACTKLCEMDNGKQVLQLSVDICLCVGEEGHKAQEGYQRLLNGEFDHQTRCKLPRHK